MAGIYEPTCTAYVASSSYDGLPQVRPKIDREGNVGYGYGTRDGTSSQLWRRGKVY